jgi:crotonobetainyl-CoA:carnitine CoA-transferase CaiB-like acyl-CoA transferase
MTAAFGICAAVLGRVTSGEGTYLDVSMTDVLATWTGPAGARPTDGPRSDGPAAVIPGYGLFTTADGGQIALGVMNEQHFWRSLCEALDLGPFSGLGFDDRCQRGAELQHAVAGAIATRTRNDLVGFLSAAGVPVAPVLDRRGMLASGPFPRFPIRLPLPGAARPVPTLDQHHGEDFAGSG